MKQKLGITIVFAIMAFVTVSCSALWRVDNSANISFSLSKEALTAMNQASDVRSIDSDIEAVLAKISLYKESGSLIDFENVILENDEAVTVEFVEIPIIGENVYAKIEATIDGVQYEGISETKKMIAEGNTLHISGMNPVSMTFTITFEANNGSGAKTIQDFIEGVPQKLAKNTFSPPSGTIFAGWATASGGGVDSVEYADEAEYTATSNVTLYAVWTVNTYTLTFNANGGTVYPESKVVTNGMPIGDLPTPSKTASIFSAWQIDGISISSDTVYEYGEDKEAIAIWDAKTYTVSFESNGGSGLDAITAIEDTKIAKPVNPEKENHIFNGWYKDELLTTLWNFENDVVTIDMTLYAKWFSKVSDVYLDGEEGDDTKSGADVENAVKTFDMAISLLNEGGTIWITDTVTVSSGAQIWQKPTDWTSSSKLTVKRYDITTAPDKTGNSFPEDLINVTGGSLTLQNITIDGQGGINNIGGNVEARGSLINVSSSGNFIISTDAVLQNNNTSQNGGGVFISNGAFTMSGNASITNNTAANSGGGVYILSGTSTMSENTSITNNTASTNGGGVYVYSSSLSYGTFNLSGSPVITGNIVGSTLNNVVYNYIDDGSRGIVNIVGTLEQTAQIGITPHSSINKATIITAGIVPESNNVTYTILDNDIDAFNNDLADINFMLQDNNVLVSRQAYYVSDANSPLDTNIGTQDKPLASVQEAVDRIIVGTGSVDDETKYTIYVSGTIETEGTVNAGGDDNDEGMVEIESATEVHITLQGLNDTNKGIIDAGAEFDGSGTITNGGGLNKRVLFISGAGANVTLGDNITLTGGNADTGGGVYVKSGVFHITGGTISENTAADEGGGVYVDDGTFNINNGALISNNISQLQGGGVYAANDDFNMSGGSISGNISNDFGGGGVYIRFATFNMSGGTIIGNTAKQTKYTEPDGGGVCVYFKSIFNMSGGTISGNTANGTDAYGGGVSAYYTASTNYVTLNFSGSAVIKDNVVGGTITNGVLDPATGTASNLGYINTGSELGVENYIRIVAPLEVDADIRITPPSITGGAVVVTPGIPSGGIEMYHIDSDDASEFTLDINPDNRSIIVSGAGNLIVGYIAGETGPGGGIVFYADNTGAYKEVIEIAGANTLQAAYNAADSSTEGGQTDWYLPNKNELNEVYEARENNTNLQNAIEANTYWSTTSADYITASPSSAFSDNTSKFIDGTTSQVWAQNFSNNSSEQTKTDVSEDHFALYIRCYNPVSYEVGETGPGGGKIFWVNETGTAYREVRSDLTNASWGDAITNAKNFAYAEKTDWYLPDIYELMTMYDNKNNIEMGSLESTFWSSSEINSGDAWSLRFYNGIKSPNYHSYQDGVHAVRSFNTSSL